MNHHSLNVIIFKCVFIFCGVSYAKRPCDGMVVELKSSEKLALERNIKRQLKIDNANIIKFFKNNDKSIAYIETYDADEVFIFYLNYEFKDSYITMWSGGAYISERENIDKWVKDNVQNISDGLAKCFS